MSLLNAVILLFFFRTEYEIINNEFRFYLSLLVVYALSLQVKLNDFNERNAAAATAVRNFIGMDMGYPMLKCKYIICH